MILVLSFFVNLLALTVPLYLLQIYDHVLASRSLETLVMLTLIVIVALAVHAILEALRRAMLARIGVWLDDRLQAPVLIAAVQSALRGDPAAAAQAWRDIGGLRSFFGGTACTALFDLPWTPIFILAMIIVHPLLGAIGLLASVVLFGLAMLNEMVTRKPFARSSAVWAESQHRFESLLRNVEAISAMGMLPGVARLLHDDQSDAKEAQLSAAARGSRNPGARALRPTSRPSRRHGLRRLAGDPARCQPGGDLRDLHPAGPVSGAGRRRHRHLEGGHQRTSGLWPPAQDHGGRAAASEKPWNCRAPMGNSPSSR